MGNNEDRFLTTSQLEAFNRSGYLKFEKLITQEQVEELLEDYNKAISGEIHIPGWGSDHVQGKVVQLAKPSSVLTHWRTHPYFLNAMAVARELMGQDIDFAYDQIIFKPPHHPAETPWHQDAGYWKKTVGRDRGVTCWLALSEVMRENGAMQFIPGNHLYQVQEHYNVQDRSEINSALETKVDASTAIAVPLHPGDATFHHCRTLHFTGGNYTDIPRCGLITHFWPGEAL